MSFVRDFFASTTPNNVPLSRVGSAGQDLPHDDSTEPGPSITLGRTQTIPNSSVPLYDEDEEDFNARAVPRRSSDRARLYPPSARDATSSVCSTASTTPVPSRAPSPPPFYYSGTSSCSSDSESEPDSPLLGPTRRRQSWRESERPRWWSLPFGSGSSSVNGAEPWRRRRQWRDLKGILRSCKRIFRRMVRHPFFPKTPVTILLSLLLFAIFGVSLTFLLIYILNPDKEPLPWRGYCTLPQRSAGPPSLSLSPTALLQTPISTNFTPTAFPPSDFDSLAPAGVFVGVFSVDTAIERRMLVRSTWASHVRSREGAGEGDGGLGTSRTIVRFILAQPRKDWERRLKIEMEIYKDIVILPVPERMNDGKTHAFFSWAANHSWVPPIYSDTFEKVPTNFTYLKDTNVAPALASHDPIRAHLDQSMNAHPRPWVRPDFVVKADDDSFIILAELEARLRVELYKDPLPPPSLAYMQKQQFPRADSGAYDDAEQTVASDEVDHTSSSTSYLTRPPPVFAAAPSALDLPMSADPLVFWGYLVKNRFMAGELYALSYALVDWIANDPLVKTMTRGAEDKQTSKWIRAHPRAQQVRWSSERCWIYDHPRAGTVYSHGFLFPSEVSRVQEAVRRDLEHLAQQMSKSEVSSMTHTSAPGQYVPPPEKWAHSSVSKFHARYSPPVPDLNLDYSVEALVEGSDMSMLHDDGSLTPESAWKYREGRRKRYQGKRVGGTIVVHFIKKNMWFLETAAALLQGEEVTPLEHALEDSRERGREKSEPTADGDAEAPLSVADGNVVRRAGSDNGQRSGQTRADIDGRTVVR